MFTGLTGEDNPDMEGKYLWSQNITARAKTALELPRVRAALSIASDARITRPALELCDIGDERSIEQFMVRENFDCFFNCPPYWLAQTLWDISAVVQQLPSEEIVYTVGWRVQELLDIYSRNIPEWKYVWITAYPSKDAAKSAFRKWRENNGDRIPTVVELTTLWKSLGAPIVEWVDDSLVSITAQRMLETFMVWIRSTPQKEPAREKFIKSFQYFYRLSELKRW